MTNSPRDRFLSYRKRYFPKIRQVIDQVVDHAGLSDSTVVEMLDYQLATGGKRLRAILPLLVAHAFDEQPHWLVGFGAACELIHNATLVHDDLQDGDRFRRGREAVWVRYGSERAINLGDAMLYLAPLCLDVIDVSDQIRWEVSRQLFGDILTVIDGQQREFELNFADADEVAYERMVVGKTSGLFTLPIAGAARLCGADAALIEDLRRASRHMGVLFQIQDDIVDLYGEKGRHAPGGDIREGKISALVVAFKKVATEKQNHRLEKILSRRRDETSPGDVTWAIEAFQTSGALDKALTQIERRRKLAIGIEGLSHKPELQGLIEAMIDLFLEPIDELFDKHRPHRD